MKRILILLTLLSLILLSACSENTLSGSLSDFYDTKFDGVRARLYPSELSIEYYRDNGEVPVRITLRVEDGITAKEYDLAKRGDITGRSRDEDIPPLESGTLDLSSFSTSDGATIEGSFEASFKTGDDTTGLLGDFEAKLQVVGQVTGYDMDGFPPPPDLSDEEVMDGEEEGE